MTPKLINAVYDILVQEAGASDFDAHRLGFAQQWPECREFRFYGFLGQGGKVWARRIYGKNGQANYHVWVDCYPEDLTPERQVIINRTNKLLAELMEGAQ